MSQHSSSQPGPERDATRSTAAAGPGAGGGGTAAIVMAGGRSVRMQSQTPKVLHQVLGRPIIVRVVEAAWDAGADPVVVVIPEGEPGAAIRETLLDQAREAGRSEPRFAVQRDPRGTADAFLQAREALSGFEGKAFLLSGDVPLVRASTLVKLKDEHDRLGSEVTFLCFETSDPTGYGRVVRRPDGSVERIVEERGADPETLKIAEVNAGLYLVELPSAFQRAAEIVADEHSGEHYVTDLVASVAASGGKACVLQGEDSEETLGVNSRSDLAQVMDVARRRVVGGLLAKGVTVMDPSSTWVDEQVEVGVDTVIFPFTVISGPSRIGKRCKVGPFTHVRAGTDLEDEAELGNFVEVKKTRIGKRSKAKHLSYLGDGQVGEGANIGAGTVFANWDGKHKHETLVGDRAFVGSGTIFVAPSSLGSGAKTGAGAVVKRGSEIPEQEVWVGVPARRLCRDGA